MIPEIIRAVAQGQHLLPVLDLHFAALQALDPRISFTRASAATYVNSQGLIATVAANEPRFTFDPQTGICRGLLIEESRANGLAYSNSPSDWTATRMSAEVADGPAGAGTAWHVARTSASQSAYYTLGNSSFSEAGIYTVSIFAKAGDSGGRIGLRMITGYPSRVDAVFDLTTGAVAGVSTNANWSGSAARIEPVGGGWYRCCITSTYAGGQVIGVLAGPTSMGSSIAGWEGSWGEVTDCVLYGAQLEPGAFATSYIPTSGSSATRAADLATISGADFSWYRQEEGTIVVDAYSSTVAWNATALGVASNDQNKLELRFNGNGNAQNRVQITALNIPQLDSRSSVTGDFRRMGIVYKNGGPSRGAANGVLGSGGGIAQNPATVVPVVTTLRLGCSTFPGSYLNGAVARLRYWRRSLSNAQLQALTTLKP